MTGILDRADEMKGGRALQNRIAEIPPAAWMLLILIVFYTVTVPGFLQGSNIITILIQAAPLLVLACGQTLVIMIQGTDLSVGSSISMTTVIWILLMQNGIPFAPAACIAVLVAVIGGAIGGFLVAVAHIPAFIATLGMQNIMSSIALTLSGNASIYQESQWFGIITSGGILFIPISVWISVICFAATLFLLKRTGFGMKIVAIGGNSEALVLAGGHNKKNVIQTFAFCGLMAGIAGLLIACRIESGNPLAGESWEFNSIAAVLLGGTSMRGGKGGVVGTVYGVLLIQVLKSGLNQLGISSIYQNAIIGSVVLGAIILDALIRKAQERRNG